MKKTFLSTLVVAISLSALTACQQEEAAEQPVKTEVVAEVEVAEKPVDYSAKAEEISKKYIIADTHIDVPHRLLEKYDDVSQATEGGDFDYPRAVRGGLDAPFMSIYTPADLEEKGGSKEQAEQLIDMVEKMAVDSPDKFALAMSPGDLLRNFRQGLISLPMGMENGSPIEGDLANVEYFFDRGIRYITLAHSLSNHLSDSSYDEARPNDGLSDFGREVVKEMNRLGMMVDVSHLSDKAFYDVLEVSEVPVIASHSSARHYTPGFERNMSDEMIKALADNGGVIFINFGSTFVSQASRDNYDAYKEARQQFMEETGVTAEHESVMEFTKQYRAEKPFEFADLEVVLDHFDHVIKLVGVDYVGIGSDYDGVGDSLPTGLKDVATYPNLIEGLLVRGYSEEEIAKILSGNLLRVWTQVENHAQQQ
ncbi:peptidase M19 [Kangiella profundi]|uniref:Peptidase M19 n=1 Tax=Kangiella profundi TaxID=1561924 RepID=A0A2K9AZ39_9GAMM|nr:dipeptidase [Kangiella profundi]AUD79149.1 peptidase M19 [Kangiella profundi]GGF01049.1 dipeptidase [Kangiella profundi]